VIVYNHNVIFKDEPLLNKGSYNPLLDSFEISSCREVRNMSDFKIISDAVNLSNRKAYYYSAKDFQPCTKNVEWALEIQDVMTFFWKCGEKKFEFSPSKDYTPELLQFWILHTLIPLYLELNQIYSMLHVGAVKINGKAILFSAQSFGGKSTMTDYFLQKGHSLISDDSVGIYQESNFFVVPSYPFHRPYRKTEDLGYFTENFSDELMPLNTMYILKKSDAKEKVTISKLFGLEKYKALHYSLFINIEFFKKQRFILLANMEKTVSIYTVVVPWDLERLSEVYDAIIQHSNDI